MLSYATSLLNALPPRYASGNHASLGIDLLNNVLSATGTVSRNGAVSDPDVDEWLHRLEVTISQ